MRACQPLSNIDKPSKESERSRWRQRENRVFVTKVKVGERFHSNVKVSLEVNPECPMWGRCADLSKFRKNLGSKSPQCLQSSGCLEDLQERVSADESSGWGEARTA